jgi:branched-chain amino acid transport system ATP-binding protein
MDFWGCDERLQDGPGFRRDDGLTCIHWRPWCAVLCETATIAAVRMLEIQDLSVSYGGLAALRGVSLTVGEGQFVAIVGPNGAGKTTLFKAISGTVAPASGMITFEGQDLLAVPPPERAHLGIAHVPEGRQVFASMTVLENLEMGAYSMRGRSEWGRNIDRIFTLFPVLAERRKQLAGTLSGGEQQMLSIGRGIASEPRLLLLDEPSMGLAPAIADLIFDRVAALHRDSGVTLLLVEQRVAEALESCDYGYVLETGRVVLQGAHNALMADERVRRAYLGM